MLITGLPEESSTIKAVVPSAVWSLEAHLLASVIELTDAVGKQIMALRYQLARKTVDKKKLKPLHIDRPGMPTKYERKGMTVDELQAMLGGEV